MRISKLGFKNKRLVICILFMIYKETGNKQIPLCVF